MGYLCRRVIEALVLHKKEIYYFVHCYLLILGQNTLNLMHSSYFFQARPGLVPPKAMASMKAAPQELMQVSYLQQMIK